MKACGTDERNRLLMKLSACKFAQYELWLFLDTHPNCAEAMQALNMHRANGMKLKEEYECKYGSLSNPNGNGKCWCWVNDPWPWDYSPQAGGCFTPSMGARGKKGACR